MALKPILTETPPPELAEHYVQKDGKFVLEVIPDESGLVLENVNGLKSALTKERSARSELEKKIGDLNLEEARSALEFYEKHKDNPAKAAEVEERVRQVQLELVKKHQKELEKHNSSSKSLLQQLEAEMITSVATRAISDSRGSIDLLMPHVRQRTRLRQSGDRYIVEVLDGEGNPMVNSQGNAMSIGELIAEMKSSDRFSRAFDGVGASGSGSPPSPSASPPRSGSPKVVRPGERVSLADLASGKAIRQN